MCVCECVCVSVCACVRTCVYALRTVSTDNDFALDKYLSLSLLLTL